MRGLLTTSGLVDRWSECVHYLGRAWCVTLITTFVDQRVEVTVDGQPLNPVTDRVVRDPLLAFISYRRDDTAVFVQALATALRSRLGEAAVFVDNTDIRSGTKEWAQQIKDTLATCTDMIVAIGEGWATLERDGKRQLDYADDWVRAEIREAIRREIPIHVVFTTGKEPSLAEASLPEDIRKLLDWQMIQTRESNVEDDALRLESSLIRPYQTDD